MTSGSGPGPLAVLGGAFDPVHHGHLRAAVELQAACELTELRLVPSANPPHRAAHVAAGELRVQMLEAAIEGLQRVTIDRRELQRAGPSYTVLTLRELRAEIGTRSLCMIVGMDAFLGLPQWRDWLELIELAHIIVAHRPGWQPPRVGVLGELVAARQAASATALHADPAGRVLMKEITQLQISSSTIRDQLWRGASPRYLMPDAALQLALQAGCYSAASANTQEMPVHAE